MQSSIFVCVLRIKFLRAIELSCTQSTSIWRLQGINVLELLSYYIVTHNVFRNDIRVSALLSLPLGLGLLLDISLNTTLGGLAVSAHLVVVSLALLVAHDTGHGTTKDTLSTVRDAPGEVAKLALGLLLLSVEVLLATGVLQGLRVLAWEMIISS